MGTNVDETTTVHFRWLRLLPHQGLSVVPKNLKQSQPLPSGAKTPFGDLRRSSRADYGGPLPISKGNAYAYYGNGFGVHQHL
jgi:hypothetical protein